MARVHASISKRDPARAGPRSRIRSACAARAALASLLIAGVARECPGQEHAFIGRVVGDDGEAVAGASVTARWRRAPELPGLVGWTLGPADEVGSDSAVVTSDDSGRFRLDLPERGPVALVARDAGGTSQSLRRFPIMAGQSCELRLRPALFIGGRVAGVAGGATPAELVLEPAATTWPLLATTGCPIARVRIRTDASGSFRHALEHAMFEAPMYEQFFELRPADPAVCFTQPVILRPPTDIHRLDLVAAAKPIWRGTLRDVAGEPLAGGRVYELHAPWCATRTDEHGRFAMPTTRAGDLAFAADGFAAEPVPKEVRHWRKPADIDMRLIPSRRVEARLVDEQGDPLADRDVLWSSRRRAEPPLEWSAKTDADGRIAVADAPALTPTSGFVRLDGRWRHFLRRVLSRHEDLGDLVVTWRALDGQVVDDHGVPCAGVRVVAAETRAVAMSSRPCWVTFTDHGGRFRFPSLPREPFDVVAEAGVRGLAHVSIGAHDPRCALQLDAGESLEVTVHGIGGRPAPGCRVALRGSYRAGFEEPSPRTHRTRLFGFTDERGVARFSGLPHLDWDVSVRRLGDGEYATGRAPMNGVDTVTVVLKTVAW